MTNTVRSDINIRAEYSGVSIKKRSINGFLLHIYSKIVWAKSVAQFSKNLADTHVLFVIMAADAITTSIGME